jgi:hypothetical protein
MRDLMDEMKTLQIEYAQTVVAYLDDHPETATAFMAGVESLERINLADEKDSQGITPAMTFGSYVIAFGQFLYPQGHSSGQFNIAMRRVISYLRTGSYLEQWEVE